MILDKLENASLYESVNSRVKLALDFLRKNDLSTLELGKYEIQGDEIFARVKQNLTKSFEEGVWEAHRKYIDVQYMVEGSETFCFANIEQMHANTAYDSERDYWSFAGDGDSFVLNEGSFAIFFPQDVHMTSIMIDRPVRIKKVIIKVLLD